MKADEGVNLWHVPTRWVHFRIAEELHDKMRAAALADRRSLSNWVAFVVERALDAQPDPAEHSAS